MNLWWEISLSHEENLIWPVISGNVWTFIMTLVWSENTGNLEFIKADNTLNFVLNIQPLKTSDVDTVIFSWSALLKLDETTI